MKKWRRSLSKLSKFIWFQLKLRRFFTAWWIKGGQIKLLLVIVGTKHFPENVQFFFWFTTCFALWKSLKTKGAWCQTKSPMLANRPYFTEDVHFWLTDCRIVVTFSLGIPQWEGSPFHTTSLCFFWHHLPWHISYTHSWRARCGATLA